jgi:hypothetical protein
MVILIKKLFFDFEHIYNFFELFDFELKLFEKIIISKCTQTDVNSNFSILILNYN